MIRFADVLSAGIDAEARGEQSWLVAVGALQRMTEALAERSLSSTCLILCPREGCVWEKEDVAFVEAAAARQEATGVRVVLVATDPSGPIPDNWTVNWETVGVTPSQADALASDAEGLVGLIPGVVGPELMAGLGGQVVHLKPHLGLLRGGQYLIRPEWRSGTGSAPRLAFDRLAASCVDQPWLVAFAQYWGNNFFVQPSFLAEQAWNRFREGGGRIGLRLLQRAMACASNPTERAVLEAQTQGMRIAMSLFDEVALERDPVPGLPEPLEAFLRVAKGWGLAMQPMPGPEAALSYLSPPPTTGRASDGDAEGDSVDLEAREQLFLLNIRALALMKVGDIAAALHAEQQIHRRAPRLARRDSSLEYINAINLARLHRRRVELEAASEWYDRAFATVYGLRTWPDAVHANVLTAVVAMARGDRAAAIPAWVRAGLHWVAADAPEGLGVRVATAVLGRRPDPGEDLTESVSARLLAHLRSCTDPPDQPNGPQAQTAPSFASLGALASLSNTPRLPGAIGFAGCGVLLSDTAVRHQCNQPSHELLRRYLGRVLAGYSGAAMSEFATVVIDDELGRELPTTSSEILSSALRLGVQSVCLEGLELELGSGERQRLTASLRVRISPAVQSYESNGEQMVTRFKRYRPPLVLDRMDSELVLDARTRPTVAELVGSTEVEPGNRLVDALRSLEYRRVVELFLPEGQDAQWLVSNRVYA